jgi:hypothetical protein
MSSETPEKPADSLSRLEALPASTAGQLTNLPSQPEEPAPVRRMWLWYTLGGLLLAGVLWFVFSGPLIKPPEQGEKANEEGIQEARNRLSRDTDLPTCSAAIGQINAQLATDKNQRLPTLPKERRAELQARYGLDDGALHEMENTPFTKLDAVYLWQCLLFRDIARIVEPSNLAGATEATLRGRYLERVQLAFAWAVRQVRLETEAETARRIDPLTLPPAFALSKGVGTPLERALVFLALLDQMEPAGKIQGCLVYCPEKVDGPPVLWAIGVLLDGKPDLYLFDPRLGLPLPARDGKGVATLGEIIREPATLAALTVQPDTPYSPTGDLAALARLRYVVSLSALAPRERYLQDTVLGSSVPVRLVPEVDRLVAALNEAARSAGLKSPEPQVAPWDEGKFKEIALTGPDLLRRFIPAEEGGNDKRQYLTLGAEQLRRFLLIPRGIQANPQPMPRQVVWELSAVPFEFYPSFFEDPDRFPRTVGLGQRVYVLFAGPFLRDLTEAHQPRDLILRGRQSRAAPLLVAEIEELKTVSHVLSVANPENLGRRIEEWLDDATKAYADEVTASAAGNSDAVVAAGRRITQLWRNAEPVIMVLRGRMARPRLVELTYQLALCKHEAAEAKQHRMDLARELGLPSSEIDKGETEQAWQDALRWWSRYTKDYVGAPGQGAALRLQARALTCLGQKAEAARVLRDLPPTLLPLDRVAALYLASKP